MEGRVKIHGLDDAMKAMRAAFPKDPERQRRLLNLTISGAARKSILPIAKRNALSGDGSGALSEALAPRAVSKSRARMRGKTASVQITPVRSNRKAIALYLNHYYKGKNASSKVILDGIRHGHLVEFGHATRGGGFVPAHPFLWPAAESGKSLYISVFAKIMKKKIALAVKRKAKK